ncbi:MAG TPA: hypothetical protein VNS32_02320 [Flavisolibacter sp.]|nr:hypothetical protein [Flavisolibacter sp.]
MKKLFITVIIMASFCAVTHAQETHKKTTTKKTTTTKKGKHRTDSTSVQSTRAHNAMYDSSMTRTDSTMARPDSSMNRRDSAMNMDRDKDTAMNNVNNAIMNRENDMKKDSVLNNNSVNPSTVTPVDSSRVNVNADSTVNSGAATIKEKTKTTAPNGKVQKTKTRNGKTTTKKNGSSGNDGQQ